MSENGIDPKTELLIDKKILEAKLDSEAKRHRLTMQIAGVALAVVGFVFPLVMSIRQEAKIDESLLRMEQKFEELKNEQVKQPDVEILHEFGPLSGTLLQIKESSYDDKPTLLVKNTGTTRIEVRLNVYFKLDTAGVRTLEQRIWSNTAHWSPTGWMDIQGYTDTFEATVYRAMEPGETLPLYFSFACGSHFVEKPIPSFMKVYHGRERPKEYYFQIIIKAAT